MLRRKQGFTTAAMVLALLIVFCRAAHLVAAPPQAKAVTNNRATARKNPLRSGTTATKSVTLATLLQEAPREVQADPSAQPLSSKEEPESAVDAKTEDHSLFAEAEPQTRSPAGTLPLTEAMLSEQGKPSQPVGSGMTPQDGRDWEGTPSQQTCEDDFYPTMFSRRGAVLSWLQSPGLHTDRNDPYRHIGVGDPLSGTSWLNRPLFVGAFAGGIFNSDLIPGHVLQNNTSLVGFRVGWDFDHYWGTEFRYGFANPNVTNAAYVSLGDSNNYLVDISLVYYPLGDARWRPYGQLGMGQARFSFIDDNGHPMDDSLFTLPFGFGLKYFATPNMSARVEFMDNLAFGTGNFATQNNISLSAGLEYRFGGKRPMFYPWHGGLGH